MARSDHDGKHWILLPYPGCKLSARHRPRHTMIGENQVYHSSIRQIQPSLVGGCRLYDGYAQLAERFGDGKTNKELVFHHKNPCRRRLRRRLDPTLRHPLSSNRTLRPRTSISLTAKGSGLGMLPNISPGLPVMQKSRRLRSEYLTPLYRRMCSKD